MFTQEQLGAIKSVVVEAIKPLEEKMDRGFDSVDKRLNVLEKKMDSGFEKTDRGFEMMDEKMENMEKSLIKRIDEGFNGFSESISDLQEDTKIICETIDKIKSDNFVMKAKLATAERKRPALFV